MNAHQLVQSTQIKSLNKQRYRSLNIRSAIRTQDQKVADVLGSVPSTCLYGLLNTAALWASVAWTVSWGIFWPVQSDKLLFPALSFALETHLQNRSMFLQHPQDLTSRGQMCLKCGWAIYCSKKLLSFLPFFFLIINGLTKYLYINYRNWPIKLMISESSNKLKTGL